MKVKNTFAKLYDTELGQILVKIDENDEWNPEVRFYFQPKNLGVCNFAYTMKDDSEESWEVAQDIFNETTKDKAVETVRGLLKDLTE